MNRAQDLKKLQAITDLVLDARQLRLRQACDARERSVSQLQALAVPEPRADLPVVAGELVSLTYQRWADLRRAELNAVIARQTVEMMAARAAAALAFGRAEALRGVAGKLGRS